MATKQEAPAPTANKPESVPIHPKGGLLKELELLLPPKRRARGRQARPVEKLCIRTGEVLARFPSVAAAAVSCQVTHCAISKCLNGKTATAGGGFAWRYIILHRPDNHSPSPPPQRRQRRNNSKAVHKICLKTGAILHTYDCIKKAAERHNMTGACIGNVCHGRSRSAGGFGWKLAEREDVAKAMDETKEVVPSQTKSQTSHLTQMQTPAQVLLQQQHRNLHEQEQERLQAEHLMQRQQQQMQHQQQLNATMQMQSHLQPKSAQPSRQPQLQTYLLPRPSQPHAEHSRPSPYYPNGMMRAQAPSQSQVQAHRPHQLQSLHHPQNQQQAHIQQQQKHARPNPHMETMDAYLARLREANKDATLRALLDERRRRQRDPRRGDPVGPSRDPVELSRLALKLRAARRIAAMPAEVSARHGLHAHPSLRGHAPPRPGPPDAALYGAGRRRRRIHPAAKYRRLSLPMNRASAALARQAPNSAPASGPASAAVTHTASRPEVHSSTLTPAPAVSALVPEVAPAPVHSDAKPERQMSSPQNEEREEHEERQHQPQLERKRKAPSVRSPPFRQPMLKLEEQPEVQTRQQECKPEAETEHTLESALMLLAQVAQRDDAPTGASAKFSDQAAQRDDVPTDNITEAEQNMIREISRGRAEYSAKESAILRALGDGGYLPYESLARLPYDDYEAYDDYDDYDEYEAYEDYDEYDDYGAYEADVSRDLPRDLAVGVAGGELYRPYQNAAATSLPPVPAARYSARPIATSAHHAALLRHPSGSRGDYYHPSGVAYGAGLSSSYGAI